MDAKEDIQSAENSNQDEIREPLLKGEAADEAQINPKEQLWMVYLSTFVAVCGSYEFGTCVGYSSPTQAAILEDLDLSLGEYSVFGSILTFGAMIGAITSGPIADFTGRKGAMRVATAFCVIGWLAIYFAKGPLLLDFGRFTNGYGMGVFSYVVPVLVAEISPKNLRGALTTLNQVMIVLGVSVSFVIGTVVTWRTLALIDIVHESVSPKRVPQVPVVLPSSLEDLDDLDTNFVPGSSSHETPLAHQAKDQEEDIIPDNINSLPQIEDVDVPGADESGATAHCLRKYGDEDLTHPNWPSHKKHVFVLSFSGKPIYTRYGDEQKLSTFTASLSGFISFVEDTSDTLRCINAGDHKIVFLLKGPLFLVIVARTYEPISHLSSQLDYTHAQVISILTQASVTKIFKTRPTFDLRILLGGTDKILDCLMHTMDNDPSYMLKAIHCLRMPSNARNALANILYNVHPEDLLFTILIAKHQLVNCLRPRRHVLNPQDLHIVMNFVNSSSSFRSSESWTPICLPNFNENAFLHGYVCFLTTDLCLVLLSTKMESFYKLSECKNAIWKEVTSNPEVIDSLNSALRNPHYSVGEIEIPSLLHFLYKSQSTNQFTAPKYEPPYTDRKERKRLFRLYQHVNHRVNALSRPHKVYYLTTQSETIVAWVTSGFELYATFGPLESKPIAIKACNQLLRWIKMEENNLFILNSPVW